MKLENEHHQIINSYRISTNSSSGNGGGGGVGASLESHSNPVAEAAKEKNSGYPYCHRHRCRWQQPKLVAEAVVPLPDVAGRRSWGSDGSRSPQRTEGLTVSNDDYCFYYNTPAGLPLLAASGLLAAAVVIVVFVSSSSERLLLVLLRTARPNISASMSR